MGYNAVQDNIYNYFLTAYAPRSVTKYDTHKKSELRSLYNSMVKLNRETPLYLIPNARESARFAVGLKENARSLRNQIASLSGLDESEMLNRKAAFSSRSDLVSAEYIGDVTGADSSEVPSLSMSVHTLASGQVNLGNFLPADTAAPFAEGTYSFDVHINSMNYEFQFGVHQNESNKDIQGRLSRLINNADIGLTAQVIEGDHGTTSLRIESTDIGLPDGSSTIFDITEDRTSKNTGMVSYLGLDYISHPATNAAFTINGEEHEAHSNSFTLGKLYEVTLNGVSAEDTDEAHIGLKKDYESLADNITSLADSYNHFLGAVEQFRDVHSSAVQLQGELSRIAGDYSEQLHAIGLDIGEDGKMTVNREAVTTAAQDEDAASHFGVVRDLTQMLYRKTNQISLNPMRYVDKTVVAYKNPGRNFANPYVTSNYSGMLFNHYC